MKEILEKILYKLEEINKNILDIPSKIMNTSLNDLLTSKVKNYDCGCISNTSCYNTACPRMSKISSQNM